MSSPTRSSLKIDPSNGPGTNSELRNFGYDTKGLTIGVKRSDKIPKTPGPGDYRPDSAMNYTKYSSAKFDFSKSPTKGSSFKYDQTPGPGHVDDNRTLTQSLTAKNLTIGVKTDKKITRTVGPGDYSPEKSSKLVKADNRAVDFAKSPTRKDNFDGSFTGGDQSFLTNYFGKSGTSYSIG